MAAVFIISLAAFLSAGPAFAGTAELTWNKLTTDVEGNTLTELTGYKIYYGTAPRTGSMPPGDYNGSASPVTVPGNTEEPAYAFSDLEDGYIYFFSVAAYNSAGTAAFSNEDSIALCENVGVLTGDEEYYSAIQTAYDSLEEDGDIRALAIRFYPWVNFNRARNAALKGGLGCDYSSVLGFTRISGLTVSNGSVTVDRIIIK